MLNYVSFLISDESSATVGEALGVLALQMMGIAVQDRRQGILNYYAFCDVQIDNFLSKCYIFGILNGYVVFDSISQI